MNDTIVALSSPLGVSAIALIRLSGPQCGALVESIFKQSIRPRRAQLGRYTDESGALLDEVVFTYYAEKASFTGEAMLELNPHGNPLIIERIIQDLVRRGCRLAEPGEFTQRAFLSGKISLSKAEAIGDLIHAKTQAALSLSQRRLGGALEARFEALRGQLLDLLAQMEAYIDFPEEDLPAQEHQALEARYEQIFKESAEMIQSHAIFEKAQRHFHIAIAGPPNAGKSTLFNALLRAERSIVSPVAGTTRDFVCEQVLWDAKDVFLVDTAGIHDTQEDIEQQGIQRSHEQIRKADLCLIVVDSTSENEDFISNFKENNSLNIIFVENKIDQSSPKQKTLAGASTYRVSAKTGEGIQVLRQAISQQLNQDLSEQSEAILALNTRQKMILERVQTHIEKAYAAWQAQESSEFVVSDLRESLYAFEQLLGRVDIEDVLDKVFSSFCIGK